MGASWPSVAASRRRGARPRAAAGAGELVDGVALVRLGEAEDVHFIVHPLGHLVAAIRAGVVETYRDGRAHWRGLL